MISISIHSCHTLWQEVRAEDFKLGPCCGLVTPSALSKLMSSLKDLRSLNWSISLTKHFFSGRIFELKREEVRENGKVA